MPRAGCVGYIGTATDITELRAMREELQRSHVDLEQRVRERTAQWEQMAMIVAASARCDHQHGPVGRDRQLESRRRKRSSATPRRK